MHEKLANDELKRLSVEGFKTAAKRPIVVVLDNVRSLHNVGSVFRTADAFLISEIYLCGLTGTPPNKEIEKTALGATSTVAWRHFKSTAEAVDLLKQQGYQVLAIEQARQSTPLNNFVYAEEKTALVFGNEVYGVEQDIVNACHSTIEIPQAGSKHSLNIAVSAGIVLWEFLKNGLKIER